MCLIDIYDIFETYWYVDNPVSSASATAPPAMLAITNGPVTVDDNDDSDGATPVQNDGYSAPADTGASTPSMTPPVAPSGEGQVGQHVFVLDRIANIRLASH